MDEWIGKKTNWLKTKPQKSNHSSHEESNYGVPFIPLRCPKCSSKDVKCYSTHLPVRYHTCRACGNNFKSVEQNA